MLGVVVVVVDAEPVPVAPRATAPTAPPPNMAATMPVVTRPLWSLVMNLLVRLGGRLAPADQEPLGISSTPPKRSRFTAGSQESLRRCTGDAKREQPPDPGRRR